MDAQQFTRLYNFQQNKDEKITPFLNETGFSLVRRYSKGTPYDNDGKRMFINVAIINNNFFYSVDMVLPEVRGVDLSYVVSKEEYKKKTTNFRSDQKNPDFVFNKEQNKITHIKTKCNYTLNELVDILESNHLSDPFYWRRKLNNTFDKITKMLFWLVGYHYDHIKILVDPEYFLKTSNDFKKDVESEPFFKYFHVHKNILFLLFIILFLMSFFRCYFWNQGDFSVSNPVIVSFFFLTLFSCEKMSVSLKRKIENFLKPEDNIFQKKEINYIERLHELQKNYSFDLKIPKPNQNISNPYSL